MKRIRFNHLENTEFQNFFFLAKSEKTRNAEGKTYVKHCNTNRRKHSFMHWNTLPTLLKKKASCTNLFKNLLDSNTKFSELFMQYDGE